jgi:hypothetical protein
MSLRPFTVHFIPLLAASLAFAACAGRVTSVGSEDVAPLDRDGGTASDAAAADAKVTDDGSPCAADGSCGGGTNDAGNVITQACTLSAPMTVYCDTDSTCAPYGATCYIAPPGTAEPSNYCECPACGGNIAATPRTCGAGLGCNNQNPDVSGVCVHAPCTFGQDQTCNDDPGISSIHGTCNANGTCTCTSPSKLVPSTGKCS